MVSSRWVGWSVVGGSVVRGFNKTLIHEPFEIFFNFYKQQIFCEKLCCLTIWFWYQIVSSFLSLYNFNVCMVLNIFHGFSKNWKTLFMKLKKSFSKSSFASFRKSVFISMYAFDQSFWLHLIPLYTFFNSSLWFKDCFEFLMQKYLPCLGYCKNLLFQAIKFHWLFPNHLYIHMGKHLFTAI